VGDGFGFNLSTHFFRANISHLFDKYIDGRSLRILNSRDTDDADLRGSEQIRSALD